jgi:thermitase
VSFALAAAVTIPSGFASASTSPASTGRFAPRGAGRAASTTPKSGLPASLKAPTATAPVATRRASVPTPQVASVPTVIDPLAPAVPGEFVAVLEPGASPATAERALEARGAKVERAPKGGGSLLVQAPVGVSSLVFNLLAAQTPGVDRVQPNYIYKTTYVPLDPRYAEQWGLPKIGAPAAWDVTKGSGTVLVAVVDTGIDLSHRDLIGRIDTAGQRDFVNNDSIANDDNGHGTHVSGIIAATEGNGEGVVGVAPLCRILPVKVMDASGSGTSFVVAEGIQYAADAGARIINLSLGEMRSPDPSMATAVAYAQGKGCVVVAAAGNGGVSGADYPAQYAGVIGVGAIDSSNARASFSNRGAGVDVVAPGVDVLSTTLGGGYGNMSGTSMASPFVAGVAALVWSVNTTWTATQVADKVLSTAQSLGSVDFFGRGLVRADLAVSGSGSSADDDLPGVQLTASPVSGTLSTSADKNDVFSVYLGAGQTLDVTLNGDAGTNFDLVLYGPNAQRLTDSGSVVSRSQRFSYPDTLSYTATATGWYYLDVNAVQGAGGYRLDWTRTGISSDNLPGVPLPASPVTGDLNRNGDSRDIYSQHLDAGQLLTVYLTGPSNADFDLWLYGPGSTSVDVAVPIAKRESSTSTELLHYVATTSGTYSVMVLAYDGLGPYRFEWYVTPAQADDNIPGVALPSKGSTSSVVGGLTDSDDVYKVFLQAGRSLDVTLTDLSGAATPPQLYLFDPTSTDVEVDPPVASVVSADRVKSLTYRALTTGYHYIDVYSDGDPGPYRLDWSASGGSDDNIPGVAAPSSPITGQLGAATDTDDVYLIHASAGQRISASLTGIPAQGTADTDFDLYLYGPGSTNVLTDSPVATADGALYPKSIGFTAAQTGDYYLQAHASAGEGTYALSWWVKSFATVTTPVSPSTVTHRHLFTIYGYVAPRHPSGTYLATLYFYRLVGGVYVYDHSLLARR